MNIALDTGSCIEYDTINEPNRYKVSPKYQDPIATREVKEMQSVLTVSIEVSVIASALYFAAMFALGFVSRKSVKVIDTAPVKEHDVTQVEKEPQTVPLELPVRSCASAKPVKSAARAFAPDTVLILREPQEAQERADIETPTEQEIERKRTRRELLQRCKELGQMGRAIPKYSQMKTPELEAAVKEVERSLYVS